MRFSSAGGRKKLARHAKGLVDEDEDDETVALNALPPSSAKPQHGASALSMDV